MTAPDSPQFAEALARLEEAEVALDQAIVDAKRVERETPRTALSEEDIRLIEEHAHSKDAPRELRELQERIDNGELSWQDIASGRHLDDPRVQAAMMPGVAGMQQAYTLIQEGQDLDDIVQAGPPAPPLAADPEEEPDYDFLRFDSDEDR